MKICCLLLLAFLAHAAEPLPIDGIAEAGFRVSDAQQAKRFFGDLLGYQQEANRFRVNATQTIAVQADLPAGEDVRWTHLTLATPNLRRLRQELLARGLQPGELRNGTFRLQDPDGNILDFVEQRTARTGTNERAISPRLRHAGVMVRDAEKAMAFYAGKLGLTEFWRGGPTDNEIRWINLRLPGNSGDYLELMLYDGKPTRAQRGSMQHICLEVESVPAAHKLLLQRGLPDEPRQQPRVGRNRRRQLNLFDADGSRVELMEPRTVDQQP